MDGSELTAEALVAAAKRVSGAESAPQLADALGLTRRNQEKTVRRWMNGENEPSYDGTLRLLTLVGLLPKRLPAEGLLPASPAAAVSPVDGEAAGSAVVEGQGERPVIDRLAGLEGHVLGLVRQVTLLGEQVERLEQRGQQRSRPAETERSG